MASPTLTDIKQLYTLSLSAIIPTARLVTDFLFPQGIEIIVLLRMRKRPNARVHSNGHNTASWLNAVKHVKSLVPVVKHAKSRVCVEIICSITCSTIPGRDV